MQTACLICNDFSISPPFTLIILRPVLNRNYKQTIEFNCRYRSHHSCTTATCLKSKLLYYSMLNEYNMWRWSVLPVRTRAIHKKVKQ
ncbi:uncharacterized protein OCT59_002394 [Rhizophagus irregularis]|uniref:uncharacterized protein n=1 Tax=Rhizophagus irregularis TaxID=588596 RepID=UPI0033246A8F|nr:hypothetical protein OCT59_002394 [Rhizophagus irregularis]